MPRKNPKDFTTITIPKSLLKELEKRKMHKNEPIYEIIEELVEEFEVIK